MTSTAALVAFDLEYVAVTGAMVFSSGSHLEQPMRTRGSLTLGGHE